MLWAPAHYASRSSRGISPSLSPLPPILASFACQACSLSGPENLFQYLVSTCLSGLRLNPQLLFPQRLPASHFLAGSLDLIICHELGTIRYRVYVNLFTFPLVLPAEAHR